ncbi:abortive phage resistance protein [Chryseobacterium lacus]|uniref:Abortive phage resistance protein n=1 Tax=Chryseobacterium lacus TaxID=2058346 RepID=A0A368N2Y6_9FLAO|nr:AIPR family protein [Chryseobacterium lacus]RCU43885.1 abortive phage resistance protein [Chryseobacterium lacus]RST28811.1 abortive phage resistance protein [Chryseobacterium lacus]
MENKELQKFYIDLQEEINSSLISEEEGTNPEQIFTELALSYLSEAGETENYRVCFDEKISKRGVEHKINGYSLYENYETLDLFVTIYNGDSTIQSVTKGDADKTIERAVKFFRNAIYKDYVNEIEESSEIFDLAQTLANVPEVKEYLTRVNIFLITNGEVKSDVKISDTIAGYTIFYRTIDINYLFNLSDKSRVPIEINFELAGYKVPCIVNESANSDYQSWLAIIPGLALADIYEQYGARLLEQNVRSFLQFTGKINKGIRNTILKEQHMFMAFNNGIAATAEEVTITDLPNNQGKAIAKVKDFQIVNGGQTTASVYHTWKKDKVEISNVFVPVKLTIVKNRENFSEIVGRIAEYANTQNRVSASDLSSNKENHVLIEKLSRTIWAPPISGETTQTRWFFERSRGQYKNERIRFGITPSKRKQFDKQNPRSQMFTKESLAKFINSYEEVYNGKKLVIGPHIVVRGSQKNYAQFLNYNFSFKPDNIWFEDAIAKAILFSSAEKVYGVKPNAIGDMRYITVPYSLAWLGNKLNYKLDLYKIWKQQSLGDTLKSKLHEVMSKIEDYIKTKAPGSLYGEWAKKEECWNAIKNEDFGIDLESLKGELESKSSEKRKKLSEDDIDNHLIQAELDFIKSIPIAKWVEISKMGSDIENMTQHLKDRAINIQSSLRLNKVLSESQRKDAIKIIENILTSAPNFFDEVSENSKIPEFNSNHKISTDLLTKMVVWDTKAKVLSTKELQYIADFAYGLKTLNDFHQNNIKRHLSRLIDAGFIA